MLRCYWQGYFRTHFPSLCRAIKSKGDNFMEDKSRFSTKRVFLNIGIYFLLFLAGDLINSLIWDFVFSNAGPLRSEVYSIVRMSGQLLLTCLFF